SRNCLNAVSGVTAVESVTCTKKPLLPYPSVPDSTPSGDKVRPSGTPNVLVAIDHVYGAFPPLAVRVWLYGCQIVAGRKRVAGVIASGGAFATIEKALISAVSSVPAVESVTCTVKELPLVVGEPDNTLLGDRIRPFGKVPPTIDHLCNAWGLAVW